MGTNWRAYGLSQSRGGLPSGPVTIMVHMASVWVPFTSESKEAVASYPEIQKEIRLGLQAVGRKLAMFVRKRHEGEARRGTPQRLPALPGRSRRRPSAKSTAAIAKKLYDKLLKVAKRKTAEADMKLDEQRQRRSNERRRRIRRQRADREAGRSRNAAAAAEAAPTAPKKPTKKSGK